MADLRAVGLLLHDGAMTMISGLVHLPFDEDFHDNNGDDDVGENDDAYVISEHHNDLL